MRAFNQELNPLGMTLPGYVERAKFVTSLPSLSLRTLAGMTPDRFQVQDYETADDKRANVLDFSMTPLRCS